MFFKKICVVGCLFIGILAISTIACKDGAVLPMPELDIAAISGQALTLAPTEGVTKNVMDKAVTDVPAPDPDPQDTYSVVSPDSLQKPTFMISLQDVSEDENGDEEGLDSDPAVLDSVKSTVSCTSNTSGVSIVKSEILREKGSFEATIDVQYLINSTTTSLNESCTITLSYQDGSHEVKRDYGIVWPSISPNPTEVTCTSNTDCPEYHVCNMNTHKCAVQGACDSSEQCRSEHFYECDTEFKQCMPKFQDVTVQVSKISETAYGVTVSWKGAMKADGSEAMEPEYVDIYSDSTMSTKYHFFSYNMDKGENAKHFQIPTDKAGGYYAVVSPTMLINKAQKVSSIVSDPAPFTLDGKVGSTSCDSTAACSPYQICSLKKSTNTNICQFMGNCTKDAQCNQENGYLCQKTSPSLPLGVCVPTVQSITVSAVPNTADSYMIQWEMKNPFWADGTPITAYRLEITENVENGKSLLSNELSASPLSFIFKPTDDQKGKNGLIRICPKKGSISYNNSCKTTVMTF